MYNTISRRLQMFRVIAGMTSIALFTVFFAQAVFLQVFRGNEFRRRADENRFFVRYIPAPRGIFTDRNGVPLVRNTPIYKRPTKETVGDLYPQFEEIDEQTALSLLAKDDQHVYLDQKRTYPFGPALSSVLGYIGEVSKEDLAGSADMFVGQSIGKLGLEKKLEHRLAGKRGEDVYEVNARGETLRLVRSNPPEAGENIALTIDASLSAKAYALLDGKNGTVVVSDPRTGEILALVSSPSYDPADLETALHDENTPMLNRAIAGAYPPGSTFKMMTALAGLMSGAVTKDTIIEDIGEISAGGSTFGNWYFLQYGKTEGQVDIVKAIQRSNDIFFYKAAELAGPERIAATARLFHFGSPTGIELSGEVSGLVPDPQWKAQSGRGQWFLGDTYHMGIGQGDVLVTPLQLNQMTAALANGGVWCAPRILQETPRACTDLEINKDALQLVLDGMRAACAPGGTAFPFFDGKPVVAACKTGTAEFGGQDERGRRKTHGLFTVMAPADQPEVVITVLVEGSEDLRFQEGSRDAAPIAKTLLQDRDFRFSR